MTTLDLEKLADTATGKVSDLVPNSSVENDGGGAYLYLNLSQDETEDYLIISAPVLFNGEDATWTAADGDYNRYWESEFTVHTDAELVAEWINSVVLAEVTAPSE